MKPKKRPKKAREHLAKDWIICLMCFSHYGASPPYKGKNARCLFCNSRGLFRLKPLVREVVLKRGKK